MANRNVYHIVPTEKGWSVQPEGRGEKEWHFFGTKEEAVQNGSRIASEQEPAQVIIHNTDGTIQEERTFGDDPRNIPG
jgi:hypothetical protein